MSRRAHLLRERPRAFHLDPSHGLSRGLVAAYLGGGAGESRLWDSSPSKSHGIIPTPNLHKSAMLDGRACIVSRTNGEVAPYIPLGCAAQLALGGGRFSVTARFAMRAVGGQYRYSVISGTVYPNRIPLFSVYDNALTTKVSVESLSQYGSVAWGARYEKIVSVSVLFDGSASGNAGRLKITIDGVLQSLSYTNTIPATSGVAENVYIGGYAFDGNWSQYNVGDIADTIVHEIPINLGNAELLASPDPLYDGWIVPDVARRYFVMGASGAKPWLWMRRSKLIGGGIL